MSGATGSCDVAETCNGVSGICPADGFVSAGTQCRASAGACDTAEQCTGGGALCPGDSFVAAGTRELRLGTSVVIAAQHSAAILAKRVATLDALATDGKLEREVVTDAIGFVRDALDRELPLLGFAGAPLTLAAFNPTGAPYPSPIPADW